MDNNKFISKLSSDSSDYKEWICSSCNTKNSPNDIKCLNCGYQRNVITYNIDDPLNPEYEKEVEDIFKDIPTVKSIAINNPEEKEKMMKEFDKNFEKQNSLLEDLWDCPNCKIKNNSNFCPQCGIPKPK